MLIYIFLWFCLIVFQFLTFKLDGNILLYLKKNQDEKEGIVFYIECNADYACLTLPSLFFLKEHYNF